MTLLDGKQTAAKIREEVALRVRALQRLGRTVGLAVVLVGDDPASAIYVRNKARACEEVGIRSVVYTRPAQAMEGEIAALLDALAADSSVDGILLQLPLPAGLNADALLAHIPPEKDVDAFGAYHLGALVRGERGMVACTPLGVMELLHRYQIGIAGRHAVVVGRSVIVGKPMALLLLNADATVTVCHSKTRDLRAECLRADIIVSAVGHAGLIGADMVKEGAVVIDVGMNRVNGKLCGDVDFAAVAPKCSYITPVPGGVGPMTVAMLLQNVCSCAEGNLTRK